MAQKTWISGDVLTASDINTYAMHEGGAWTTWVPVITQGATPTLTVNRAVYARAGRLIHFQAVLALTSSGTSSNNIAMTLPVASATSLQRLPVGGYTFLDISAGQWMHGVAVIGLSSSTVLFIWSTGSSDQYLGGSGPFTDAVASGDILYVNGFYEAAS